MKVYSPDFSVFPASPYPSKSHAWESLKRCKDCYAEFVADCDRWGQVPLPLWVYVGKPAGDERSLGYPNYPDYIVATGKRGGIICERVRG